nr:uncharacterized protein LOC109185073 [Ipomoea batatas]
MLILSIGLMILGGVIQLGVVIGGWCVRLFNSLPQDDFVLATGILYALWLARNNDVWKGMVTRPHIILHTTFTMLQGWQHTGLSSNN